MKKNIGCSTYEKRRLIERKHRRIAIYRQCILISLSRSSYYYRKIRPGDDAESCMRLIDETYTKYPFFGVRRITTTLKRLEHRINHKQVARLMRMMGLEVIYPKPRLSMPCHEHRKYPYLLRHLPVARPDQVWGTDITYILLRHGFVYLAAIMDWFSRYVVAWSLSITLDADFCVDMLKTAL